MSVEKYKATTRSRLANFFSSLINMIYLVSTKTEAQKSFTWNYVNIGAFTGTGGQILLSG